MTVRKYLDSFYTYIFMFSLYNCLFVVLLHPEFGYLMIQI